MSLADTLSNLKAQAMKEIGEAAKTHDTQRITMLSGLANRIEEDERVLSRLEEHMIEYRREMSGTRVVSAPPLSVEGNTGGRGDERGGISKRNEGRDARKRFVDALQGRKIQLMQLRGKEYRTAGGRRVGIAFANELEGKPDRWFLGLKDGNYGAIVLLCVQRDGKTLEFILPQDVLAGFWRSLSRHGGDVKFNLLRDGANFYLLVPPQQRESINRFLGVYQSLKG